MEGRALAAFDSETLEFKYLTLNATVTVRNFSNKDNANHGSGTCNYLQCMHNTFCQEKKAGGEVFNGIAYDHQNGRLWVTGKLWAHLFEVHGW
eukprot:4280422-Amphidinium_carterae.1